MLGLTLTLTLAPNRNPNPRPHPNPSPTPSPYPSPTPTPTANQSVWLYLEPIFASEDIMRQMPTEAKRFTQVDRLWRKVMLATVAKPNVLLATAQEGLLGSFQEANRLLELIQKGLNDYLEKKRLAFARLFFLSNDELLQILSETKEPNPNANPNPNPTPNPNQGAEP